MNDFREHEHRSSWTVAQPLRLARPVTRRAPRTLRQTRRCRNFAPHSGGAPTTSGEDLMSMLLSYVKSFARNEEGQDLLEYALLVALIALIAIGAVGFAGQQVDSIFNNIATELSNAA
jgi:pilus assembly protein Flp/PilA